MIKMFRLENNSITEVDDESQAQWIHIETPTDEQADAFARFSNLPTHILKDVFDIDEMPHLDSSEQSQIVFVDVPIVCDDVPKHQTRPLCASISDDKIFTITGYNIDLCSKLKLNYIDEFSDINDLFIVILFTIMATYIEGIKTMENASNWDVGVFNDQLKENKMFFDLLDMQKSLIDYETSIEANRIVISRIAETFGKSYTPYQNLLLGNLSNESTQVAHMCDVFGSVLQSTSSIAESIVSNNLNGVMKSLTSLTILFTIPAIIVAIFTMNALIPGPFNHFLVPIVLSAILCYIAWVILKKKNLL